MAGESDRERVAVADFAVGCARMLRQKCGDRAEVSYGVNQALLHEKTTTTPSTHA